MQSLQVVLAENNKEELRERRHQTGDNGAHKERIEGVPPAFKLVGAGLEHSHPLAALRHRHQAREGEFFSGRFGESRAGEYQASVEDLRGAMACRMRRIETDLEDFGIKKEESEKGDLGRGEREQSK